MNNEVLSKLLCSFDFTQRQNEGVIVVLENFLFPCPSVDQINSLRTFRVWDIYTINISTLNLSGILFLEYLTLKIVFQDWIFPAAKSTHESYIKFYII